jgi:uncharacterized RDD family membrane protein YckC
MHSAPTSDVLLSRACGLLVCVGVVLAAGYGLAALGIRVFAGWGWLVYPLLVAVALYVARIMQSWILKVREVGRRPKLPPL